MRTVFLNALSYHLLSERKSFPKSDTDIMSRLCITWQFESVVIVDKK